MKNTVGLGLPGFAFTTDKTVLIVGAGLAGCAIAQTLAKRGYRCRIFDQQQSVATATSALPAAVVRPAINSDELYTHYFKTAFDLCCKSIATDLFSRCGALELIDNKTDHPLLTEHPAYTFKTAQEASELAGTALGSSAIHIAEAGYIRPPALCNHWLQHPNIEISASARINALRQTQQGWQLLSDNGVVIDESRVVVLATAQNTTAFDIASELPLQFAAGQIDLFEYNTHHLQCVVNGRGYLLPETQGVWCGATHHRLQKAFGEHPLKPQQKDSITNKITAQRMAPKLATAALPTTSFAAVRTFTPDRLPMVGALHDTSQYRNNYAELKHGKPDHHYPPPCFHEGVYLAAGLGSRGATQALLIGELIGNLITGEHLRDSRQPGSPAPMHNQFLQALHPARFLIRSLRRGA